MSGQPLYKWETDRRPAGLGGVWRAVVAELVPLTITIPKLTGDGLIPNCETAIGGDLEPGDKVWAAPIEGSRDDWVVIARRV